MCNKVPGCDMICISMSCTSMHKLDTQLNRPCINPLHQPEHHTFNTPIAILTSSVPMQHANEVVPAGWCVTPQCVPRRKYQADMQFNLQVSDAIA